MSCGTCYYCIRGEQLLCHDFPQLGIHMDGTYAEYVKAPCDLVHTLPGYPRASWKARSSSRCPASSTPPRR